MGIIKALDQSSILRLAAGEIIDRPVSIIKELIENSIDAKATQIIISLQQGGISEIIVEDNGQGILNDDIEKTILPHATSKLDSFDDLKSVMTMGFRGEALASISEVADVMVHSFNDNDDLGAELSKKAISKEVDVIKKARETGTTVTVAHLFKHIPVRYRFLKTPGSEASAIYKCVQQFSLHYPSIGFRLLNNHAELLNTYGKGDLVFQFRQVLQLKSQYELIPFRKETNQINVSGVILEPTVTFKNRNKCWFSVNHRMVQAPVFFKAIQQALQDIIPKQTYPAIVCNIKCASEDVDINMHPKKESVKFVQPDQIFIAIKRAVQSAVNNKAIAWMEPKETLFAVKQQIKTIEKESTYERQPISETISSKLDVLPSQPTIIPKTAQTNAPRDFVDLHQNQQEIRAKKFEEKRAGMIQDPLVKTNNDLKWVAFKNKFILLPLKEDVFIFDQHAVHERILYDQFKQQQSEAALVLMPLLVPEYVKCTVEEYQKVNEILESLQAIGIDIKAFDKELYVVRELPQCLNKVNISDWILNVINEPIPEKAVEETHEEVVKQLQLKACKAAVKAGQRLSDQEVTALINTCIESDVQYTCPHGRPLYIKLSEKKLDSLFLRS